jgi:DNA modification methylase
MNDWINRVHFGDCLETLRRMPDGIVNTCVTSPPYFGLRDYGHPGQIGLEETPEQFIAKLVEVFREVRRVLRDDGTCWVNMGDSYATRWASARNEGRGGLADNERERSGKPPEGYKNKDLIGVPWMLAFALRADGWYLRQDIIWAKPNPMPESVTDRCTKSHEYIFLLSKSPRYYCDMAAIAEVMSEASEARLAQDVDSQHGSDRVPGKTNGTMKAVGGAYSFARKTATEGKPGAPSQHRADREPTEYRGRRNKRSVWTVSTKPYSGAHFATYPEELIEPCILAGAPAGGVVLDPFFGSGTTGSVAQRLGRKWIGCELNPSYKPLQDERLTGTLGLELT